jgi:hypothetical protein
MNCDQVHEKMLDYLCGGLPPGELEWCERHIGECAGCRAELARLRQGEMLLRRARAEAAAPASLDTVAIATRAARRLERSRRRWRRFSAAAAAAAGLLVMLQVLSLRLEVHRTHLVIGWSEPERPAPPGPTPNGTQLVARLTEHETRLDDLDKLILALIQKGTADEQRRVREAIAVAQQLDSMQEQNDTRWRTFTFALRNMRGWPLASADVPSPMNGGEEE